MKGASARLPVALALLAAIPVDGVAARAIPCAPPLDQPLTLNLTQHLWRADGKPVRATITRTLRFGHDRDGFSVTAYIAAIETDQADPRARQRLLLGYGAPGDVPIVVRLDPAMTIVGIESLDARWTDFRRRQAALAVAMAAEGAGERASALGPMLDAMGPSERVGLLSAFLAPVLRHCGTAAPEGATTVPDGMIRIEILADSGPMRDVSRYGVDPATGLLRVLDRSLISAAAPLRPLSEHWTLDPQN